MWEVQRARQRYRGGDPAAGIDTWHAFSFAGFYDPDNVHFGPLTACNEERLAPGAGFPPHPHRDLEIVSWVIEGELTHEDPQGRTTVIRPGDVQRLTAGFGVRHAERNAGSAPLRFLQMWLIPSEPGGEPEYEVVRGLADTTPYPLPRTRAMLHVRRLRSGGRTVLPAAPWVYVHVVRGVADVAGERLAAGDALRVTDGTTGGLAAQAANEPAELLMWELHTEPSYD